MKKNHLVFLIAVVFSVIIFFPQASKGEMQWSQVNDSGFGDPDGDPTKNWYVSSMLEFNDKMYASTFNNVTGTQIWMTSNGFSWIQSNNDGFDASGSDNDYTSSMIEFNNKLYAAIRNNSSGAEIWSTSDGSNWMQSNNDGFGDSNNVNVIKLIEYNNKLYAGTSNDITGAEMWCKSNGEDWTQVNTSGFDNDANNEQVMDIVEFNDRLYAGVRNSVSGVQIWSTNNGTDWDQSNFDGFNGDTNSNQIRKLISFNNYLYAGLRNTTTGAEVWFTNGTWDQSNIDGFNNDTDNGQVTTMYVYNGKLYATMLNSNSGTEVWSTSDGLNWAQSNTDGFGDCGNTNIFDLKEFNNSLFAATFNTGTGVEIWKKDDNWMQSNTDGFGNSNNWSSYHSLIFNNKLYYGTFNNADGTEVWTLADVTNPIISNQSPSNSSTGVDIDANISFQLDDEDLGVDSSTLDVTIEGSSVITNGTCQSGYSCTITDDGSSGYGVVINPSSKFHYSQEINISVSVSDNDGDNSTSSLWSFITEAEPKDDNNSDEPSSDDVSSDDTNDNSSSDGSPSDSLPDISPRILTISGLGEPTRLQAYSKAATDGSESLLEEDITGLFPDSYLGGAGVVPIDQSNNNVLDQFLIFAANNGGPQARVMGLRSDGSTVLKGQMFVFDSSIRDGLSAVSGDFDNDGYTDDAAFCLTGDYAPHVKVFTDVSGIDNWTLLNQFTIPDVGATGCNLGTFQYDTGAEELLITPNHGPATPNVYIYTVGGTEKEVFQAYD